MRSPCEAETKLRTDILDFSMAYVIRCEACEAVPVIFFRVREFSGEREITNTAAEGRAV